jgi:hypothetical protein
MDTGSTYDAHFVDGVVLLDTGAIKNYISAEYAKRANIKFLDKSESRTVALPNGGTMKVLGQCKVDVKISEWEGTVEVTILDMQADFDLVLGMGWHLQWKPVPDWNTLDWFVNAPDGAKRIEFNPDLNGNVKILDKDSAAKKPKRIARKPLRLTAMEEYREDLAFTCISEKEVKRTLRNYIIYELIPLDDDEDKIY